MPRCLYTVEDSFFIKGRGLVTLPGIVPCGDERYRIGDRVEIRRPDGSRLEWAIGGIEMINCTPPRLTKEVVFLLRDLGKEDVPIGSEIWSIDG
jgi:translation elongation factor EF-Tu-like GTPase